MPYIKHNKTWYKIDLPLYYEIFLSKRIIIIEDELFDSKYH